MPNGEKRYDESLSQCFISPHFSGLLHQVISSLPHNSIAPASARPVRKNHAVRGGIKPWSNGSLTFVRSPTSYVRECLYVTGWRRFSFWCFRLALPLAKLKPPRSAAKSTILAQPLLPFPSPMSSFTSPSMRYRRSLPESSAL